MTNKELKKLSRTELVEMLLLLTRENELLTDELSQVRKQLDSKLLLIENAGSLADASMQLNQVFEAAQAACAQYLENIQHNQEKCDKIEQETQEKCHTLEQEIQAKCEMLERETREKCNKIEQETQAKCMQMLSKAKQESDEYWAFAQSQVQALHTYSAK